MVEVLKLDPDNACIWQGTTAIPLTPKTLAVVECLIANAGSIVTKEKLLNTVWPQEEVSEYALTSVIRDLRRALGDSTKKPRYIQTVHRRGYRWLAPINAAAATEPTTPGPALTSQHGVAGQPITAEVSGPDGQRFTGRIQELEQLHHHLQLATVGQRQLVFLTGEAGIGKTTLLEQFTDQVKGKQACAVAFGQCIERYGPGEAYLPVLEALNRLCHQTKGKQFIPVLEQYAPSWLMQMSAALTPAQLLQQRGQNNTLKERWLRELAEALEIITQDQVLILVLEDLHWGDPSTIELLDLVARRKEAAKLLILASYRPAAVSTANHPIKHMKQELQLHHLCQEIALGYLNPREIEQYLLQRFPDQFGGNLKSAGGETTVALSDSVFLPSETTSLDQVALAICQRTEGCPLFMVNVVDSLVDKQCPQGDPEVLNLAHLVLKAIPDNLKQLIDLQFDALAPEQQTILEAASVEGIEFLSVTIAASLHLESEQVEQSIDELVQLHHLITLDDVEILPDGSLTSRYRFIHALYQEGLYQRISQNRRIRLHRAIGLQLETMYSDQVDEMAAPLALHFEQGMEYVKAIRCRRQAGENALKRNGHPAAIEHFHQGLALLHKVRHSDERDQLELGIQPLLGTAFMTLKGQAAPEVGDAFERAQYLCPTHSPQQFDVTLGLWRHTFITGNLDQSLELAEQCFTLAKFNNDLARLGHARYALASTFMYQGKLDQALAYADAGLEDYRALSQRLSRNSEALRHSQDPSATLIAYRAWILYFMGYWDQAVQGMDALFDLAIVRSHPQTTIASLTYTGILNLYLREYKTAQQQLEQAIQLGEKWHIRQFVKIARFFLNVTLQSTLPSCSSPVMSPCSKDQLDQHRHRLSEMENTLNDRRAVGADLHATGYLNRLAEGYLRANQTDTCYTLLAQSRSLMEQNHERVFEADIYRLKGEFLLSNRSHQNEAKAETALQDAIQVARQQNAKTFELRAALDLAQLWNQQGNIAEAKALLTPVYNQFTEGFDFSDLKQTQQLLETLAVTT